MDVKEAYEVLKHQLSKAIYYKDRSDADLLNNKTEEKIIVPLEMYIKIGLAALKQDQTRFEELIEETITRFDNHKYFYEKTVNHKKECEAIKTLSEHIDEAYLLIKQMSN